MSERLHKLLAQHGLGSRRQVPRALPSSMPTILGSARAGQTVPVTAAQILRDRLVEHIDAVGFGAHGLHVLIGDDTAEHRWTPDVREDVHSVAKGVCVLAAGLARRMGRPKLLLDLTGKPVLRWSVEAVAPHVDDLIVVTGPEATRVQEILHDLPVRFAVNPRPEDGQGASIAAGAAAVAVISGLIGDDPRRSARRLLDALTSPL